MSRSGDSTIPTTRRIMRLGFNCPNKEIDSRVAFMKKVHNALKDRQTGDSGVSDERAVAGTTAKVSSGGTAGDRRTRSCRLPPRRTVDFPPENTFWCLKRRTSKLHPELAAPRPTQKMRYPHTGSRLQDSAEELAGWLVGGLCPMAVIHR